LNKRGTRSNLKVSNRIGPMRPRLLISVVSSLLLLLTPSLRATEIQWPGKVGSFKLQPGVPKPDGTPSFLSADLAGIGKESGFVGASPKYY
jgi:hypothetical protein